MYYNVDYFPIYIYKLVTDKSRYGNLEKVECL